MLAVAAATGAAGVTLLVRSFAQGNDTARYLPRLIGTMLAAFGLILLCFATAYVLATG